MLKPTQKGRIMGTYLQIANNRGAGQTARMRRLVCTFVVRKQRSQVFLLQGPYDGEAQASWPSPLV